MNYPQIKTYGPSTILLEWPALITDEIQAEVRYFSEVIEDRFYTQIVETVITYQSLAVYLREGVSPETLIGKLEQIHYHLTEQRKSPGTTWVFPICFEANYGPDQSRVAEQHGLSVAEMVSLYAEGVYEVSFIGFLPGFPYLSGLDPRLHTKRLPSPRKRVSRGSVAIGGSQTGIYPQESPGGWNIIGRCPLLMFSSERHPPCLLKAGDRIRFQEVNADVFKEIAHLARHGLYHPQTVADDTNY